MVELKGFLQEAVDIAKSVGVKINPILDWVAVRVGEYVDISADNIHTFLILAIAIWVSSYINRDKGIKFWVVAGAIFAGLRYVGV